MVSLKKEENTVEDGGFHDGPDGNLPSRELESFELRQVLGAERDRAVTTVWEAIRAAHYTKELDDDQRPALISKLRQAIAALRAIDPEALHDAHDLKTATDQITIILTSNI